MSAAAMPRSGRRTAVRAALGLATAALVAACGGDPAAPSATVESIVVSAPVGSVLAVGATVPLTAHATGSGGRTLSVAFEWRSSDPAVAEVDATGAVSVLSPGTVRVEARSGTVAGTIDFSAVNVATDTIRSLLADPFTVALRDGADATGSDVATALDHADAALTAGDVLAVDGAFDEVDAMATAAADADARALLATLTLIVDRARARLGL